MKILLLTHGRTGSSSFQQAISDVLNLENITEPFNKHLWDGEYKNRKLNFDGTVLDNTILKTICGQNDIWITKNVHRYDKVLLLARDNIRDTFISLENAREFGYINEYTPTQKPSPNVMQNVVHSYSILFNFYRTLPCNLIWYDDIFNEYNLSKKTTQSLELDINDKQFDKIWDKYLNPSHRLRKENSEGNKEYSWISENHPPLKQNIKRNELI